MTILMNEMAQVFLVFPRYFILNFLRGLSSCLPVPG